VTKRGKRSGLGEAFDFRRVDPYGAKAEGAQAAEEAPIAYRHIETILPDPAQPRRLLPSDLAEQVAGGSPPNVVLLEWQRRAQAPEAVPFLAENFAEVAQLADSIAEQGLINPVTVREVSDAPPGVQYRLVTGERRWWAHVLLAQEGRRIRDGAGWSDPTQIKVSIVAPETPVRSQQLAENWHRADMSVLDRAYGLWALRRELSGVGEPAAPGDSGDAERLVPWTQVEKALGVSRQHRVRILKVLDLSPEAQQLVELYRLPERTLRPISAALGQEPALQVTALKQVIAWQQEEDERNIVASVAALVNELQAPARSTRQAQQRAATQVSVRQVRSRVRSTVRLLSQLEPAEWQRLTAAVAQDPKTTEILVQLRAFIDELLADE
jgi:hypothetical protein